VSERYSMEDHEAYRREVEALENTASSPTYTPQCSPSSGPAGTFQTVSLGSTLAIRERKG
jgi:hypothetical protein